MLFSKFLEAFENPSRFLLNPANNKKSFPDLEDEFRQDGGQHIGSGKYGNVYDHPNWNYVVKTFNQDDVYLKFVRFAYKNPHPAFPKFYGPPQQVLPNYLRYKSNTKIYIVRMEKLFPVQDKNLLNIIIRDYSGLINFKNNPEYYIRQEPHMDVWNRYYKFATDLFAKHPQIIKLLEGIEIILNNSNLIGAVDMHNGNIMQRANGELVIIDPLWEGSNPYADAQMAFDRETDNFFDDDPEPPNVIGGKYPKKAKKKKPYKPKPYQYDPNDNVPF